MKNVGIVVKSKIYQKEKINRVTGFYLFSLINALYVCSKYFLKQLLA